MMFLAACVMLVGSIAKAVIDELNWNLLSNHCSATVVVKTLYKAQKLQFVERNYDFILDAIFAILGEFVRNKAVK